MLPDDGSWGTKTCRSHIKRYFKIQIATFYVLINSAFVGKNSFVLILESLYWQQLSDEIISIHVVAIYCNKSQLILGKKDADLARVFVCRTQCKTRRR